MESFDSFKLSLDYDKDKVKSKLWQNNYIILNNDSSCITFDDSNLRLYRSIILDAETNELLCFSPPNSIDLDTFTKKYPSFTNEEIYANEIIEGTMINLFYDKKRETWEIATRGSIGGNYWYYKTKYVLDERDNTFMKSGLDKEYTQKTFRQMFLESLRDGDEEFIPYTTLPYITSLHNQSNKINNNPIIQQLDKSYTYSFVLQHPDNHIVLPITEPHLFLIGVFKINAQNHSIEYILPTEYEKWPCFSAGVIEFPKNYSVEGENLKKKYNILFQTDYSMGIMLFNMRTKERSTIMNPVYEELKNLRGNNPNLQYQYFCLMKAGQVEKFLGFFPRYTKLFIQFNRQYHDMITNVHKAYYSYYVKKEDIIISKKFFIHASRIHHQIYLPSLRSAQNKIIITRNVVNQYFDSLKPNEILYYLHYDKRKIALENNII